MEQLQFKDYEELACGIADTFDSIDDEYGEISVIAKYNEAKEIIKELLCIGYDVASMELHREKFEEYWDEYIITLNFDGVWCEKFRNKDEYLTDDSKVIYIIDNCSSAVIQYCKSEYIYEVSVDDSDTEESVEHSYMVNGESVDKETFDDYVSKFATDLADKDNDTSNNSDYSICVKRNLNAYKASKIIKDMEYRMMHMNDMLCEMDGFR